LSSSQPHRLTPRRAYKYLGLFVAQALAELGKRSWNVIDAKLYVVYDACMI
jgi:hypothetical protein